MTTEVVCPRCASPMLLKTNRSTGEGFLGCSRFPGCRGTRPATSLGSVGSPTRRPTRYGLSAGGRPRDFADYSELLVARVVGRNLTRVQGCIVQLVALIVLFGAVWLFVSEGGLLWVSERFAEWYAGQIHLGPSPGPTP